MNENIKIKDIILLLCALVLILINICIIINLLRANETNNYENEIKDEKVEENNINEEDTTLEMLKKSSERERMEFYFSEFIDYIENGKYQEAYNLLYPDFKDNYFKTLDDFKKYVNKTYPEFVSFSYNDIERQGNIYVLMITVINPDLSKSEAKKSQRIVIKENNFNDFVLSFQVI